jgi:rare lipoprotein A
MSIDTLSRLVFTRAAFATALICSVAIDADATAIVMPPPDSQQLLNLASLGSDAPMPRVQAATFAERFALPQLSLHDSLAFGRDYMIPGDGPSPRFFAAGDALDGAASTYDPTDKTDRDAGNMITSSGERYDRDGWTAAIRTDLRWQFGGVRFGRNYKPTFALVECGDKRLIVKINDVGPLRPGRIVDLNTRAMRYLDPSMQIGVLENVKVTPLASTEVAVGPVEDHTVMAGDFTQVGGE